MIITLKILTKETARNTQRSVKEYLVSSWSECVWLVAVKVGKKIRTNRGKRGATLKYHVMI